MIRNKQKKKFVEQERTTCSRAIECEWFVDDYDKKNKRWILQTVDDAQKNSIVSVLMLSLAEKILLEFFVWYVTCLIVVLSCLKMKTIYLRLIHIKRKEAFSCFSYWVVQESLILSCPRGFFQHWSLRAISRRIWWMRRSEIRHCRLEDIKRISCFSSYSWRMNHEKTRLFNRQSTVWDLEKRHWNVLNRRRTC